MKVLSKVPIKLVPMSAFAAVLIIFWTLTSTVSGQTLKADYQFQGSLNSSTAGAPAMTNITGPAGANSFVSESIDGYSRQSLRFPKDSGLSVNTNGVIPNNAYTAVILFKMDELNSFRRVFDATNGASDDCGAYIFDSRFETESTANTNSILIPQLYFQAVVVRESTGRVRAYRDGRLKVDLANDQGCFQIGSSLLRFFRDDNEIAGEASAGNVARIRLYDAPMTDAQVRALDRAANAVGGGEQRILSFSDRDGNFEIYSMNADGSNQLRLTNNSVTDSFPDWSPVRQKIVFNSSRDGNFEIYTMNLDGTGVARITNNPLTDYNPRWSPNGNRILFSRCQTTGEGICDVWVMNADGSGEINLTNNAADDDYAQWSPDGTKFVFASRRDAGTTYEIYTANADGTNLVRLTNNAVTDYLPAWSPNGAKIAFATYRNGVRSEIYSMDANGANAVNLSNNNSEDNNPVWSPDGSRLMFSSYSQTATPTTDAGDEIFVMNANGSQVTRLTFNNRIDLVNAWRGEVPAAAGTPFDYDGDGRADLSVYRPSDNIWYLLRGTAGYTSMGFGVAGDLIAPSDYDGDAKTDIAVFRPSSGIWYFFNSATQSFSTAGWGQNGDIPAPADHDGDGKSDLVVFRPSNNTWYTRFSSNNSFASIGFGVAGDKPVVGDFDGDDKADIGVFRPSDNNWYTLRTSIGFSIHTWGQAGDVPVPADYDGDGKTDLAIFRPSTGQWFRNMSQAGIDIRSWGESLDKPVAADYDGDGKADIAVFRQSNGTWYIVGSTAGIIQSAFGQNGDLPTQGAFIF